MRESVGRWGIEDSAVYNASSGSAYRVAGYYISSDGEAVAAHTGEAPREVYEGWIQ